MPTETRRITFSSDELVEALVEYDRHAEQKLTCGIVGSVNIDQEPDSCIVVDVQVYDGSKNLLVSLHPKYLGAALVMFCVKRRIPVPQNPIRYLKRFGENIAICFGHNAADEAALNVQVECL